MTVESNRPGPGTGPNVNQNIFGLLGTFIQHFKFERQHILLCGDHVAALSKVSGTVTETMPPGFDQIIIRHFIHYCPYQLGNKFPKETILNIWRNDKYFLDLLIYQLFGYNLAKIQLTSS